MRRIVYAMVVPVLCFFGSIGWADNGDDARQLERRVSQQDAVIDQQQEMIQALIKKVADLEKRIDGGVSSAAGADTDGTGRVSLSGEEFSSVLDGDDAQNVLARPWYRNIRIDGFGAGGIVFTGGKALKQHGGFINYEATINVDAQVWENVAYFHELQTIRMGDEATKYVRTGEAYVHLKDLFKTLLDHEGTKVGLKIGRMDIPFGEDYLTQDVIDNPLITFPAAYAYGWDEGVVLYGRMKGLHWIFGVMDGNDARGTEDNKDKFTSFKVYGQPIDPLYLSASFFRNGKSDESALELGGSHLDPVGSAGRVSALGRSGSSKVDSMAYELDAKYMFGDDRYLKAQFGQIMVDDKISDFDRNIRYFLLEPKWNLGNWLAHKWYLVGRYSAVGTFNENKGFTFDGKPFAGGKSAFGYDVKALHRYAVGLGFQPNPRVALKLEYSLDDFRLIKASGKDGGSEGRDLIGFITSVKF